MRTPLTPKASSAASAQLAGKLALVSGEVIQPLFHKFEIVLAVVSQAHGVPSDMFLGQRKMRSAMEAKIVAASLAVEFLHPPLSTDTISFWLNVSRGTAYKLLNTARTRAESDPAFRQHLDTLRAQIRAALNQESSNGQR